MKKILILLAVVFIAFGCQKQERKLDIVSAPQEDEITAQVQTTAPAPAEPTVTQTQLPPMVSPKATSPQALAQHLPQPAATETAFKTFYVYADKNSPGNHFIPSGYMGDSTDIGVTADDMDRPYAGSTCIKISYNNRASNGARWAGMYWQNPANNWGSNASGGFDLTGARKLTFWARGEKGGERVEEFKMGGIAGAYPDSDSAGIGPVVLTQDWKQYTIDLSGKDLSHIIGGFAWATNVDVNPDGCVFYLDEIRYE